MMAMMTVTIEPLRSRRTEQGWRVRESDVQVETLRIRERLMLKYSMLGGHLRWVAKNRGWPPPVVCPIPISFHF